MYAIVFTIDSWVQSLNSNIYSCAHSANVHVSSCHVLTSAPMCAYWLGWTRCAVLCYNPCTLVCFYAVFGVTEDVMRIKGRLDNDLIRDALLNVRMTNGNVVEVQLAHDPILMIIKSWYHSMYEITRTGSDAGTDEHENDERTSAQLHVMLQGRGSCHGGFA